MQKECPSNQGPFPQAEASVAGEGVADAQGDELALSKKDLCVLCFSDIYGAPYEIFGEWRNGALFF